MKIHCKGYYRECEDCHRFPQATLGYDGDFYIDLFCYDGEVLTDGVEETLEVYFDLDESSMLLYKFLLEKI